MTSPTDPKPSNSFKTRPPRKDGVIRKTGCTRCAGEGEDPRHPGTCLSCDGNGTVTDAVNHPPV